MAGSSVTSTFLFLSWCILASLRLLGTFIPLPGYLHPDEYFQSTEVLAGDVFNLKVLKTWEFNGTTPIRSMAFPLMTSGLPFHILKYLNANYFQGYANFINPYTLVVAPRVFMVLLSFSIDFFIFRICRNFGFRAMPAVMLFSSSYVVMTYYMRTLSNATEGFLFAYLLYVVSRNVRKMESPDTSPREGKRKGGKDKEKKSAKPNLKSNGSSRGACRIASIIVAATFNRPTFPAFALVPFICWLLNDTDFLSRWTLILKRLVLCVLSGAFTALIFIIIDSIYYKTLDSAVFFEGTSAIVAFIQSGSFLKKLTITPINFIRYNMDNKNLETHGTHPKYTHLLANLPMLFGPLATLILLDLFRLPAKASTEDKPENRNRILVYLSVSIPVIILSIFPHQEPRFLIPLLIPVAIMYGSYLFGSGCYKSLCLIWMLFNLSFALFYGVLHQGGMFSTIQHLQKKFYNERHLGKTHHVIFYHTYMPPWHLFTLNQDGYVGFVQNPPKKPVNQRLYLHDLAGSPPKILEDYLGKLKTPDMSKTEILVVSPASIDALFCTWKNRKIYKFYKGFALHLTMEDLPNYEKDIECKLGSVVLDNCNRDCRKKSLQEKIHDVLSLFVYKVEKLPDIKEKSIPTQDK